MFDLIDIQREKYPNVNKYSYLSKALDVKSRIDFLLVAKNLTKYVEKSDIQPSIAPDHCAVYIILSVPEINSRGPGFWKLNNSLLAGDEYLELVGELLEELDNVICKSDNLDNVEKELKYYDELKRELNEIYERKGRAAMFRSKCRWVEKASVPPSTFLFGKRKL